MGFVHGLTIGQKNTRPNSGGPQCNNKKWIGLILRAHYAILGGVGGDLSVTINVEIKIKVTIFWIS